MLRTSSQEGGLQERTESPKATSGAPNCFVRPVAVASIFRPALGGSRGVGGVDEKPAVPEKRRSVAAKESKLFGSSLSNEEFSRRRQSFDTKTAISLGHNILKRTSENRISNQTLPKSEYVPEQINEISTSDEKGEENSEGRKICGQVQNCVGEKLENDNPCLNNKTSTVGKPTCTVEKYSVNREEKKNSKNISHIKAEKFDQIPLLSSGSGLEKVTSSIEDNVPAIQNGVIEDGKITAVEKRSRSRTAATPEYVQTFAASPIGRRSQNKFSQNICVDKESNAPSAIGTTKTESIAKSSAFSSQDGEVTGIKSDNISSKLTSGNQNVNLTEYVPQPVSLHSERRSRDRTSQDVHIEKNQNLFDAKVVEKAVSSQKCCEANCNLVSKVTSTVQTKCESQVDTNQLNESLKSNNYKKDSIEAFDTQSESKYHTRRRTSDVIAAKIQSIFSKSDKPLSLSSSNKLSSSKSKISDSVSGKEPEPEICPFEEGNNLFSEVSDQKVDEFKNLAQKGEKSPGISLNAVVDGQVLPLSGDDSNLNKSDVRNSKKPQNVKCLQKAVASCSSESQLKLRNKTPSETGSFVGSNVTVSPWNDEKSVVRSHAKDVKFNIDQKLCESASSFTVSFSTGSEKKSSKLGETPACARNDVIGKKEISTVKELIPNSLSVKKEKVTPSVTKKPVASINFLITEVSVENSTLPLKINTSKVLSLQAENKETSQSIEQKSYVTQKSDSRKSTDNNSKVNFTPKSEINAEVVASKSSDKNKVGRTFSLKEESKVLSANQQQEERSGMQKSVGEENTKVIIITGTELVNSKAVILKASEKNKVSEVVPLKQESKVKSENLQQKCSQVQKSNIGKNVSSCTKTQSYISSQPANSTSQILKPLEKDTIDRSLAPKENSKVPLENMPQKTSQTQKSNTEGNLSSITRVQSSAGGESVNSETWTLKPSEKDKGGKTLPPKIRNKVASENLVQKSSSIQKLTAEEKVNHDTKAQNLPNSDLSAVQMLKLSSEKDNVSKSSSLMIDTKVQTENLPPKTSKIQKSGLDVNTNAVCSETVNSKTHVLKALEKDKTDESFPLKEASKVPTENLEEKSNQLRKNNVKESTLGDLKAQISTGAEFVNSVPGFLKKSEEGEVSLDSQVKENKVVPKIFSKKSDIFQKWSAKENASCTLEAKKVSASSSAVVSNITSSKQLGCTITETLSQKSERKMSSENIKQKFNAISKLGVKEPVSGNSCIENIPSNNESVNSCDSNNSREQCVDIETKPFSMVGAMCNSEKTGSEDKIFPKVKKNLKQEQKLDEIANHAVVKKVTSTVKKTSAPVAECSQTEGIVPAAKSVRVDKVAETGQSVSGSQNPTVKKIEKLGSGESIIKQAKYSLMQHQDYPGLKAGKAQKELISTSNIKQTDAILTNSVASMEDTSKSKNSALETPIVQHSTKMKDFVDLPMSAKCEAEEPFTISPECSCYQSQTQAIYEEPQKISGLTSVREKGCDGSSTLTNAAKSLAKRNSSVFNTEFYGRSSSCSKLETPRPPERRRSGFAREISTLMSPPPPPYVPIRSMPRTGSLTRPNDSRLSIERSLSVLRSSSQSILGPSYTPQRISYTEMLSKLGTCGRNSPLTASNGKFGISQVSELWTDLGEEQSNSAHTSEMLESETSERVRLEKEVQELQSRYSQIQQKSDKMEMEMMEARVYRATEVNGDLSEEEENDATVSIYKQKYGRAVRDMEIMKRRLQQQHEEEMEQSLMLKKAADKRLTEALEDIEEERQVVNQWKRKAQKLGAELQDLRLMLEEQMARNGELEKKQRRFDAELSSAQDEIRKEHQLREKLTREKDQAQLEKYSLEQELQATRLDMDMQHEKIAILNRELDELSLSSKGEEEVTQLKRAKQEVERKARDQEEELEELAGQVQMLEQSKLRLEMSLEKLRQEHRRESSVRDEEIEEIRASSSKKIKNLEAQLENEQEERHQLVKQKHELERRIIELSDQPLPQDPEIERRLRRDLKRTKALLRDAQSMLEHVRDGQANKTFIRQLKNQLEDAEFTKSVAIKARQTAELELQELQSQSEEVTRTKNDIESRCLQLTREKSALQTQLEEMEEEMAEIMKKYKAIVAQMSIDQKSLAEQIQQISELESEKLSLKEQLADVSSKLDHISVQTEDSARVHRLDAKVRDLESKLELEQTTRSRLEHQISRLKEQCDRSREECDSLRSKELQAQEGARRLQRQLRELREDYAALQQKESEAYRKQHELEMALENTEADLQVTKNDLRLACQRIQDLQNALEDDLDSGTDVPDDSGSESGSSLDVSVLGRQCLTPLQRSDSTSSNTSVGSDGRQFRALSHSQDMASFSRMMRRRTPMDFLI